MAASYEFKHKYAINPSNSTSSHCLREINTYVHRKTCIEVNKSIAALFIIAKKWKQPKNSTNEWISKV